MSPAQTPSPTAADRSKQPDQTVAAGGARPDELETSVSSLAIPNRRSNEARRCQGYHCAVKAALLEEYDRAEQVMADDFQVKNSIE
jgi:hypothetical protein